MTVLSRLSDVVLVLTALLVVGGCSDEVPSNPDAADTTYGTPFDPTDAVPVPAVAAEPDRYRGRRVTVDGRVRTVSQEGCTLQLDTETGPPLRVEAIRSGEDSCAWQIPAGTEGIAVAAGTLRVDADTLRLTANGVRVTPLQQSGANSSP